MNKSGLAFLVLIAALAAACSNPHDKVLPTDPSKWAVEMNHVVEKLPLDERAALTRYAVRHTIGASLGSIFNMKDAPAPIAPGTTVAMALKEQKDFEDAQAKKVADAAALKARIAKAREEAIKLMEDAVAVAFIERKNVSDSFGIRQGITVTLAFENRSAKDIAGIKGRVVFQDVFGDQLSDVGLSFDKTIAAGKTTTWSGTIEQFSTGFHKLRDADPAKTKFHFNMEQIIFSDGSKLVAPTDTV